MRRPTAQRRTRRAPDAGTQEAIRERGQQCREQKRAVRSWIRGTVNSDFGGGKQVLYWLHSNHVSMSLLKKCLIACILLAMLIAAAAYGAYRWATTPVQLATPQLDVTIKPHSSLRSVTTQLNRGGVPVEPELFVLMTRALGLQTALKSGNYEFKQGITPYDVLQKIARGDVNEYVATIIEGWTFKRMRAELDANTALRHDSVGLSD